MITIIKLDKYEYKQMKKVLKKLTSDINKPVSIGSRVMCIKALEKVLNNAEVK